MSRPKDKPDDAPDAAAQHDHRDAAPDVAGDDRSAPSKSQRKRDADALHHLAARLAALPPAQRQGLPLDDALHAAVAKAAAIKAHGGRKRQLKFVAKLLRQDAALAALAGDALERISAGSRAATARQHRLERLTEDLIARPQQTLQQLLAEHPDADRQLLRRLASSAARERELQRTPRSRRRLFRYLRELAERDEFDEHDAAALQRDDDASSDL